MYFIVWHVQCNHKLHHNGFDMSHVSRGLFHICVLVSAMVKFSCYISQSCVWLQSESNLYTIATHLTIALDPLKENIEHMRDVHREVEKAWSLKSHKGEVLNAKHCETFIETLTNVSDRLMDCNEILKRHARTVRGKR